MSYVPKLLADSITLLGYEKTVTDTFANLSPPTRLAIQNLSGQSSGTTVWLREDGREGFFKWIVGDQSAKVTSDPLQGIYIAPLADPSGASGIWQRVDIRSIKPEWWGAKGDGNTNDTDAFVAASVYMKSQNGGILELRKNAVYIVGKQRFLNNVTATSDLSGDSISYTPSRILWLENISGNIIIKGNGATMRAPNGMLYGTFSETTPATPTNHPLPYYGRDKATPYDVMIGFRSCTGNIRIENLELDGNCENQIWGGKLGDVDWQIPCSGIAQDGYDAASIIIENVNSHHHCQDGIEAVTCATIINSKFNYNCRNGISVRSGTGWLLIETDSLWNGRGSHASAPASGMDIEAEYGPIRKLLAINCRFMHNLYQEVVSDSGPVSGAHFLNCTFASDVAYALFISKPRFVFDNCLIVGPFRLASDGGIIFSEAPKFNNCHFTDDPAYTLNNKVNNWQSTSLVLGVKFSGCTVDFSRGTPLPDAQAGPLTFIFTSSSLTTTFTPATNFNGTLSQHCAMSYSALTNYAVFDDDTCMVNGVQIFKTSGTVRAPAVALPQAITATTANTTSAASPSGNEFNDLVGKFNALLSDVTAQNSKLREEIVALRTANIQSA